MGVLGGVGEEEPRGGPEHAGAGVCGGVEIGSVHCSEPRRADGVEQGGEAAPLGRIGEVEGLDRGLKVEQGLVRAPAMGIAAASSDDCIATDRRRAWKSSQTSRDSAGVAWGGGGLDRSRLQGEEEDASAGDDRPLGGARCGRQGVSAR